MKKIFLIDVKIPYDNVESFSKVPNENKTKYPELATELSRSTRQDIITDCIVDDSLGSWDPENGIPLKRLAISRAKITYIAKSLTSLAVTES